MTPETLVMLQAVINLLLGGGLIAVLRHRVQMSGEKRTDFNSILQAVTDQRDEAWAHNREQDARIANLEAEINGLRLARDLDPFPNWVVDRAGEYQFVNREFERLFLEPQSKTYRDAIGKTHKQLGWPTDFCKLLVRLDANARQRPDGRASARATLELPQFGQVAVTVHKFPIRYKDAIVAYAGFVTDISADDKMIGMPVK